MHGEGESNTDSVRAICMDSGGNTRQYGAWTLRATFALAHLFVCYRYEAAICYGCIAWVEDCVFRADGVRGADPRLPSALLPLPPSAT